MNKKFLTAICMIFISISLVNAVSITEVSSNPSEVAPGGIINIIISVENILDYDLTNLDIKLDLSGNDIPFAPFQSSSEKFLEKLSEGDKENLKFKLRALPEAHAGIYKIPVFIEYDYSNGDSTMHSKKQDLIGLTVNSEPQLKVLLEDSNLFIKGQENELTLKVINSGMSDIKFLYITALETVGVKFLDENMKYLGDIDSDDFDNADYKLSLSSDAPDSLILPINVRFMDATNKEFTQNFNIVLSTYSLKEAKKEGLVEKPKTFLYLLLVLFAGGYILYRFFKKKKLRERRE